MDQTYSKDDLEKLFTKYLAEPLRTTALENLQTCECYALGGDNCTCQDRHPESGFISNDFNPFSIKLAPQPAESRVEKELQVTSSAVAKNQAEAQKPKHKLAHYDTIGKFKIQLFLSVEFILHIACFQLSYRCLFWSSFK